MAAKNQRSWYAVRTLYRLTAAGPPKRRDKHYDPAATLVEERVVLFLATGFEDALAQGEKEASDYCRQIRFTNWYGQRVRARPLSSSDAYQLVDDRVVAGSEVYSSTDLFPASTSDRQILKMRMGPGPKYRRKARMKFVDGPTMRKGAYDAEFVGGRASASAKLQLRISRATRIPSMKSLRENSSF